jgi:O-Antigen ligase
MMRAAQPARPWGWNEEKSDRQALVNEGETASARRRAAALAGAPELIPGFLALGVFVIWTISDAGLLPTDSYPGALFLLGVLGVTAYGYRTQLPALPRIAALAIGLFAAFTVWSFLSITWADDQGAAWDGANRCLLYLTVFSLFALPAWRSRSAALLLGFYAVAMAAIAAITLLGAAGSAEPFSYLIADRFSKPTGYYNANAALFTAAIFPAVLLASRREVPWPLRGLLLASAGVLFDFALLPQSRGWLIVAPLAFAAYLVLTPDRVRSLVVIAPVALVGALTASPILDVFDAAGEPGALGPALDKARDAMLIGAASLFVAGAALGLIEGRLRLSEVTARRGTQAVGGLAWIAALAGVIVAIGVIGNPISWADDRWEDFKSGQSENPPEGSRLGSGLGSNRYDFWRVAVDEFADSPLAGVGSNNFAADYVRDRRSIEEPAYSHNLPLGTLSETGLVGAALFVGFVAVALVGVARVRLRSEDQLARGVAAVAAVAFFYMFAHSTGDWFWATPALWAPVFAWLGIGIRVGSKPERPPKEGPVGAPLVAVLAGLVGVLLALSLALPWAAAVDVKKAGESWGADPQAAFDRLDRASSLNFLSANPLTVEGAIASRLGDRERMRVAFEEALERDPRNWYATLELAALDAIEGDRPASLERLDRVSELNPREPVTEEVRQRLLSGSPLALKRLDDIFLERYCLVHGQVLGPSGCETP